MLPAQIQRAIKEFSRLPGVGPKSAERLTFYLLKQPSEQVQQLAESLNLLKNSLVFCDRCCNYSEKTTCQICDNLSREREQVCIVEDPMDVFALENTGAYKGLYHVLHGAISPLDGIGPERLTIEQLMRRLDSETVTEIILATNPTVTGEATAVYISRLLKTRSLRITHLAQGIPMGGQLEFADQDTLKRALLGRREG